MKLSKISGVIVVAGIFLASCKSNNDQSTNTPPTDTTMLSSDTVMPPVTSPDAATAAPDTMSKPATASTPKKMRKVVITTKAYPVNKKDKMEADVSGIYPYAEVMPSFPGGEKALGDWLEKNINYPEDALNNDVEGDVVLSFSVDETGKVYTPTVISKKLGYGLEEEAISVVNKMPNWNPGRIKGKNVKTKFTLPISFQLQ